MSIYRTFKRSPKSDVHHVADHIDGPPRSEHQPIASSLPEQDWTARRKASPAETLLPATVRWIRALPGDVQPRALSATFPRIANMLANLWSNAAAWSEYMNELFVDRRGSRRGFPLDVLTDLHKLRAYYATVHPDQPFARDELNRSR
jgi:hypothetical protein